MSETLTVNGVEYVRTDLGGASPVQIVVLQRGWVVIGYLNQVSDTEHVLTKSAVIRRWGTTKGLGELRTGPTDNTVLDPSGVVRFHPLTTVLRIDCDADAWAEILK